jgi:hypothetical protein
VAACRDYSQLLALLYFLLYRSRPGCMRQADEYIDKDLSNAAISCEELGMPPVDPMQAAMMAAAVDEDREGARRWRRRRRNLLLLSTQGASAARVPGLVATRGEDPSGDD